MKRLAEAGIDVEQAIGMGQLELRVWHGAFLRRGRFDQDRMLALVEEMLQSGAASGYPLTRLVGWATGRKLAIDDRLEYETRLNYVLRKYDDPVICSYDLSKFSASAVIDIMWTHPVVIIGEVLQENPFFVPPDQFLFEIRERRRSARAANPIGPEADALRLRRALRDLVALSTFPAAWVGREPAAIADVLVNSLHLDFAFVRLCDPSGGAAVEITRGSFPEWLQYHLAVNGRLSRREIVRDIGNGAQPLRSLRFRKSLMSGNTSLALQGLHLIRHYGLLANGNRAANIERARELLAVPSRSKQAETSETAAADEPRVLPRPCRC